MRREVSAARKVREAWRFIDYKNLDWSVEKEEVIAADFDKSKLFY